MNLFDAEVARMRRDAAMIHRCDEPTERMLTSFANVRAHRLARGESTVERTKAEIDAEELAVFNRAEARAINNGFN